MSDPNCPNKESPLKTIYILQLNITIQVLENDLDCKGLMFQNSNILKTVN